VNVRVEITKNRFPQILARAGKQDFLTPIALAVEAEAKVRCPVRTGNLRNSIHTWVEGPRQVAVGTFVHYAPYVEFGTRRMAARPYLRPAADAVAQRMSDLVAARLVEILS